MAALGVAAAGARRGIKAADDMRATDAGTGFGAAPMARAMRGAALRAGIILADEGARCGEGLKKERRSTKRLPSTNQPSYYDA